MSNITVTGSLHLYEAAVKGDIEYVRELYRKHSEDPRSPFIGSNLKRYLNLFHVAIMFYRYTFLLEALNILRSHPQLVIELLCQKESKFGNNPFHFAAQRGNIFTLKVLVNAYARAVSAHDGNNQETPPWLAKNYNKDNPLCCCFGNRMTTQESIARYLVSLDEHLFRTLGQARYPVDGYSTLIMENGHRSIVFIGMQRGFSLLVKQILISDLPYALSGENDETPLHYASKCNEQVSRLLLEKHPELIRKVSLSGKTMLDHAIEDGATWFIRLMLSQEEGIKCTISYRPRVPWTKACKKLLWHMNKDGDTPLHIAARKGDIEISKLLIQGFKSALQEEAEDCYSADDMFEPGYDFIGVNPLYIENHEKDIPLVIALRNKHDDYGVMLTMETFPLVENCSLIPLYIKCLPVAMDNGCLSSAKMILERVISQGLGSLGIRLQSAGIKSPIVRKMADHLTTKYPVKKEMIKSAEFEKLLEVLPRFQGENEKDSKTILKEAVERGEDWFVKLALESDTNLVKESAPAWQVACEKGYYSTLLIFFEVCDPYKFTNLCQKEKRTPLHCVKLMQFAQYVELLKRPLCENFKNQGDSDGATPLHRAIERQDFELTKALLEMDGINFNIEDNNGRTALDLLENNLRVSTSWFEHYTDFFKVPLFKKLLNKRDKQGKTPLHHAIQRDDLGLTKALLETEGIDVSIKDNNGRTALDLLQKNCRFSPAWGKMCGEIKQHSALKKLEYIFRKISFEEMKDTMSVVAALVATITFAAGFTVPGGSNNKDGTPVLATNVAFLAFFVSNTIAMCCSIMVLFILLGPMMWDPYPSLVYVNLSLILLLMSLGGTMVAFLAGVYATMASKVKWETIFVIVLCSLILFMACIVLLSIYSSLTRLLSMPYILLKKISRLLSMPYILLRKISRATTTEAAGAPFVATANTSQQTTRSSNTLVTTIREVGQSSGTSHPAPDDIKIQIKHS